MKISVDGGSFQLAIETDFEGLVGEAIAIYKETFDQAGANDKTLLRFLQIIIEHGDEDEAIGYAVFGLLGWYHLHINPVEDEDIVLNLPKIIPHLINPVGDMVSLNPNAANTFKH
ncbi:hypothetical protein [Thaumasiovibrio subtropicus]|uniref:hypothetical protein n=1 Tax=Thaumasiovibrio subtropicus TaxID=1891207 RepID=UPI000B34AD0E|nr:hypothetical protein [Thaumasiovibrio subtropicus]